MKIAVAATKAGHISKHFGKSAVFFIYDFKDGQLVERERRDKDGGCGGGDCSDHGHHHDHGHGHGHAHGHGHGHSGGCGGKGGHNWFDEMLGDCHALICGGMGPGAVNALKSMGIEPVIIRENIPPEVAATLYVEQRIVPHQGAPCTGH